MPKKHSSRYRRTAIGPFAKPPDPVRFPLQRQVRRAGALDVGERSGWSRSKAWAALACALAAGGAGSGSEAGAQPSDTYSVEFVEHIVARGETLSEIAARYGASVESVAHANRIDDPRKLWVGARLRIPIEVGAGSAPPPERSAEAEDREAAEVAALLDRCESELRAARFERALASAGELRERIDARSDGADAPLRVRLEVASATAQIALGRNDEALESFERALTADPDLELDRALTSPKVLAVFRVARSRATPTR